GFAKGSTEQSVARASRLWRRMQQLCVRTVSSKPESEYIRPTIVILGPYPRHSKMKHLFLLALISSIGAQADNFLTGQAARAVIGQVTFPEEDVRLPTNQFVLGAVSGVAYANNTLFVVDSNHIQATPIQNRVLIYNNLSGLIPGLSDEIPQGTRCPICVGNGG